MSSGIDIHLIHAPTFSRVISVLPILKARQGKNLMGVVFFPPEVAAENNLWPEVATSTSQLCSIFVQRPSSEHNGLSKSAKDGISRFQLPKTWAIVVSFEGTKSVMKKGEIAQF